MPAVLFLSASRCTEMEMAFNSRTPETIFPLSPQYGLQVLAQEATLASLLVDEGIARLEGQLARFGYTKRHAEAAAQDAQAAPPAAGPGPTGGQAAELVVNVRQDIGACTLRD